MASSTISAKPSTKTVKKHYPDYKVVVKNDDHNTFDHVVKCFVKILPGMTPSTALSLAEEIHTSGSAVVWVGPLEQAELYHMQLGAKGLTMAPLESD